MLRSALLSLCLLVSVLGPITIPSTLGAPSAADEDPEIQKSIERIAKDHSVDPKGLREALLQGIGQLRATGDASRPVHRSDILPLLQEAIASVKQNRSPKVSPTVSTDVEPPGSVLFGSTTEMLADVVRMADAPRHLRSLDWPEIIGATVVFGNEYTPADQDAVARRLSELTAKPHWARSDDVEAIGEVGKVFRSPGGAVLAQILDRGDLRSRFSAHGLNFPKTLAEQRLPSTMASYLDPAKPNHQKGNGLENRFLSLIGRRLSETGVSLKVFHRTSSLVAAREVTGHRGFASQGKDAISGGAATWGPGLYAAWNENLSWYGPFVVEMELNPNAIIGVDVDIFVGQQDGQIIVAKTKNAFLKTVPVFEQKIPPPVRESMTNHLAWLRDMRPLLDPKDEIQYLKTLLQQKKTASALSIHLLRRVASREAVAALQNEFGAALLAERKDLPVNARWLESELRAVGVDDPEDPIFSDALVIEEIRRSQTPLDGTMMYVLTDRGEPPLEQLISDLRSLKLRLERLQKLEEIKAPKVILETTRNGISRSLDSLRLSFPKIQASLETTDPNRIASLYVLLREVDVSPFDSPIRDQVAIVRRTTEKILQKAQSQFIRQTNTTRIASTPPLLDTTKQILTRYNFRTGTELSAEEAAAAYELVKRAGTTLEERILMRFELSDQDKKRIKDTLQLLCGRNSGPN